MPSKEQQHHAPIQPLLASQLFSAVRHKTTRTAQTGTLCAAIDEALRGGIGIGKAGLVCVTGDKSSGRTAVSLRLDSFRILCSSPMDFCWVVSLVVVGCLHLSEICGF